VRLIGNHEDGGKIAVLSPGEWRTLKRLFAAVEPLPDSTHSWVLRDRATWVKVFEAIEAAAIRTEVANRE